MKTKTYNVTFFNMAGDSLGTVAVQATTPNKAKIMASTIHVCSWVSMSVEAA